MEIFEFICELFLAVVATTIAVFQWRDQIKISKEEKKEAANRKEEKQVVQTIVSEICEIEKCNKSIWEFDTIMTQLSRRSDSDPNNVMKVFDETIETYETAFKEMYPRLKRLYDELLINEERFPMSHGYGRYISDLRKILDFESVLRERRANNYDSMRIQVHQILVKVYNDGGYLPPEVRLELGKITEQMVRSLEPYYKHALLINSVLYELKKRYENM